MGWRSGRSCPVRRSRFDDAAGGSHKGPCEVEVTSAVDRRDRPTEHNRVTERVAVVVNWRTGKAERSDAVRYVVCSRLVAHLTQDEQHQVGFVLVNDLVHGEWTTEIVAVGVGLAHFTEHREVGRPISEIVLVRVDELSYDVPSTDDQRQVLRDAEARCEGLDDPST